MSLDDVECTCVYGAMCHGLIAAVELQRRMKSYILHVPPGGERHLKTTQRAKHVHKFSPVSTLLT